MKTTRTWIFVAVLCVIGVAWGWARFLNPRRPNPQPGEVRPLSAQMPEVQIEGAIPNPAPRINIGEIVRLWPGWLEAGNMDSFGDPSPPVIESRAAHAVVVTNILISAIWLQGDHRIAVINGLLVREGFDVSSLRVRRIESDAVIFTTPTGMLSVPIAVGGKLLNPVMPSPAQARPSDVARSVRTPGS